VPGQAWKYESAKGIQFQKDLFTFMIYMR